MIRKQLFMSGLPIGKQSPVLVRLIGEGRIDVHNAYEKGAGFDRGRSRSSAVARRVQGLREASNFPADGGITKQVSFRKTSCVPRLIKTKKLPEYRNFLGSGSRGLGVHSGVNLCFTGWTCLYCLGWVTLNLASTQPGGGDLGSDR